WPLVATQAALSFGRCSHVRSNSAPGRRPPARSSMRPSAALLVLEVTARNGTTGASKNESLDTNVDNRRTGGERMDQLRTEEHDVRDANRVSASPAGKLG